jgi:predicted negative regulator of RcsB-dependent stress response
VYVEDLSDLEREEQLRSFWRDNWLTIVGGIAIGLGGIAGWRYWQSHSARQGEQAEGAYAAVLEALGANKREDAVTRASALRKEHPSSPYADQADLALARAAVERGELDEAAKRLRAVVDSSRDAELRQIARTRLARVLIEQSKPDEALALLDPANAGAFAPHFHDIRGDALAAKGDAAAARREYEAALAADPEEKSLDRGYVALKRDSLPKGAEPQQQPQDAAKPGAAP